MDVGVNKDFPYKPPSIDVRERYRDVFSLEKPPGERMCKLLFDKIVSLGAIVILFPVFLIT